VALWNGIVAPAGTSAEIISRLNGAIVKSLNQADMKQRLAEQGSEPSANSPAEFRQFIATESEKWARIVALPDVQEYLAQQGLNPFSSTPEQLATLMKTDMAKWAKVIKTANIKLEN
jgi:tripartite-type tricarboxylate transporter receptor subunit TctC